MIYEISHRTLYRYGLPVSISHHQLHLGPRTAPWQSSGETALEVSPAPSVRQAETDYFGNPTMFLTIQQPHRTLSLHALSVVEVSPRLRPLPSGTPPWESVRDAAELEAVEFCFPSPSTVATPAMETYASLSFPPGRPCLEAALDLNARIHRDFVYEAGATSLATTVGEAFGQRRGVCQDFAHIALACLRSLGLPARYVSGYLLTRPPEGREKLVGADASHAWVGVHVPGTGWVDLDPTNDLLVDDEHITLAWGRDYGDVSPVSGVIYGGGEHEVQVAVDVRRIGRRPAA